MYGNTEILVLDPLYLTPLWNSLPSFISVETILYINEQFYLEFLIFLNLHPLELISLSNRLENVDVIMNISLVIYILSFHRTLLGNNCLSVTFLVEEIFSKILKTCLYTRIQYIAPINVGAGVCMRACVLQILSHAYHGTARITMISRLISTFHAAMHSSGRFNSRYSVQNQVKDVVCFL